MTIVCGVALYLPAAPAAVPSKPRVTCRACLLVDDTGRVLFRRHSRVRLANASTTKMATALLVARADVLEDDTTISAHAAATGGGGLDLSPGDTYDVRDLLVALLLSSSNEAAVALAEHVAGTETRFVAEMNELRDDLGLGDTRFETPHGLDVRGHYSSPRDLSASRLQCSSTLCLPT